jgi:hypothetical protein
MMLNINFWKSLRRNDESSKNPDSDRLVRQFAA